MNVAAVYAGSDAEATKALYARLEERGPLGLIAVNLLRAHKASTRAKVYRGGVRGRGSFKSLAYKKKEWSLRQLCEVLCESAIVSGWKEDPAQEFHRWVLYVDLPTGQVSFHSAAPIKLPALDGGYRMYSGEWDGQHLSGERIIRFAQTLLDGCTPSVVIPATQIDHGFRDDRTLVQAGLFL
jgi:hypothetical protein